MRVSWLLPLLLLVSSWAAPVPPNYAFVPDNFYWDALPSSIPVLESYDLIVTNVARLVNYGALGMGDGTFKCLPNAFGFFTGNIGKRTLTQIADSTICGPKNKTVTQAYAFYILVVSEYPDLFPPLSGFLNSIGLDVSPDTINQPIDLTTDVGLGLQSGRAVANFAAHDGINSQGDANGAVYNKLPYSDYTNYGRLLENTAFDFNDCNEWEPGVIKDRQTTGYCIQYPVTPQTRWGWNMATNSMSPLVASTPHLYANCKSLNPSKRTDYFSQASDAIERVASLNDYKKMQIEHFEDKLALFFSVWGTARFTVPGPYTGSTPWESDDDMYFLAVGDPAGYAGGVYAWSVKYYSKSVRPRNIIKNFLKDEDINSWGGPYKGTVAMKGRDFESYVVTMGHPDYPSGTTCFAEALIQSFKLILRTDALPIPITVPVAVGTSKIEPGIPAAFGYPAAIGTPSSPLNLTYQNLTEYSYFAGESRLDAGVHFQAAVDLARVRCPPLGTAVYYKVTGRLNGSITTILDPDDRDHYTPLDPLLLINWFDKPFP